MSKYLRPVFIFADGVQIINYPDVQAKKGFESPTVTISNEFHISYSISL